MRDFLGDSPVLKVNGLTLERLRYAMQLGHGFDACGYREHDGALAFARYESAPEVNRFPTPLGADRCADLAWDWLQKAEYPTQPDHDGDNERGWLLKTDGWGHVEGLGYQYFISIRPTWIMFGK